MPANKALVVDDEADVRAVVVEVLMRMGWEAAEAENGEEALHVAAGMLPDLVVLDIMMPGMDGREVFAAMRRDARLAHTPIIMLSSVNDYELGSPETAESLAEQFRTAPPQAFVNKPIEPKELRAIILEAVGEA